HGEPFVYRVDGVHRRAVRHIDAFGLTRGTRREDHISDLTGIGKDWVLQRIWVLTGRIDRHTRDPRTEVGAIDRQSGNSPGGGKKLGPAGFWVGGSDSAIGPPGGQAPGPPPGSDLPPGPTDRRPRRRAPPRPRAAPPPRQARHRPAHGSSSYPASYPGPTPQPA